jgi:hypothetical protein
MTDGDNQEIPDQRHRSFVPSDFSMRDISFMLLVFIIISVVSVVLGLFVESLFSFWRGYLWGIVTTILAVAILRQMLKTWPTDTETDVENN